MAKYGLNQVTLIGNLGKDPELKYLDQGIAVTSLRMACTESYRDKNGNNVDKTEWVTVNLWRGQAEIAAKYCKKGSTVCIHGKLTTRSWETPQGEKRSITEVEGRRIILLDSRPPASFDGATTPQQPTTQSTPVTNTPPAAVNTPPADTSESSLPKSEPVEQEDLDDLPF